MQSSVFQHILGKFVTNKSQFFIKMGNLETRHFEEEICEIQITNPIYITGLARSGTTLLLELLNSHPDTVSHQYRDFPLVHIPIWWNWFLTQASSKNQESVERAHKDRIKVTPNSPEAMEEMLWMAFFDSIHNSTISNVLINQVSNEEFEEFYKDHIKKLLFARKGKRYLVKGNYNISRINYLNKLFPDARFVIAVRSPEDQIASLMKQHRLYCELEENDPKILTYMQRSGHFEFGLDRRLINFGDLNNVNRIQNAWNEGNEIKGWAIYWSAVYSFVADILENNPIRDKILIVHYNDLCKAPAEKLKQIYTHCRLEVGNEIVNEQASQISAPSYYETNYSKTEFDIIQKETSSTVKRIQNLL